MSSFTKNQPIKPTGLSDQEYLDKIWNHLAASEGKTSRIYSDPLGIPTMGAGVALAVKGEDGTYALRNSHDLGVMINGDPNKPYIFKESEMKLLEGVTGIVNNPYLADPPKERGRQANFLIPNHTDKSQAANKFGFELSDERLKQMAIDQFAEHSKSAMGDVRKVAANLGWPKEKIDDYVKQLEKSDQGVVLTSLRYGGVQSPKAIEALLTGDRPAFRDEILYRSNGGKTRELSGIAIRRQKEADIATGDPSTWSEEEQKKWQEIENGENAVKYHGQFPNLFPGKPIGSDSEFVPAKPESPLPKDVDPGQYLNNPDQVGEGDGVKTAAFGFLGQEEEDHDGGEAAEESQADIRENPEIKAFSARIGGETAITPQTLLLKDNRLWTEDERDMVMNYRFDLPCGNPTRDAMEKAVY